MKRHCHQSAKTVPYTPWVGMQQHLLNSAGSRALSQRTRRVAGYPQQAPIIQTGFEEGKDAQNSKETEYEQVSCQAVKSTPGVFESENMYAFRCASLLLNDQADKKPKVKADPKNDHDKISHSHKLLQRKFAKAHVKTQEGKKIRKDLLFKNLIRCIKRYFKNKLEGLTEISPIDR